MPAETPRDVFERLLDALSPTATQRSEWMQRYLAAQDLERRRRAYNDRWTAAERGR